MSEPITAWKLRKLYPQAEFWFFDKEGYALRKAPFAHEKVSRFKCKTINGVEIVCLYY